jgi:hypothetical protein
VTDQLTGVGSEQSGNPAGGNGAGVEGSAPATAATGNSGPSNEPGNLDWAKGKGWVAEDGSVKTEDVLSGYRNLEKKLGSMKTVPGAEAKPEEWDAFHKSQGWPGEPKAYEFKRPEGLPENLPYDEAMADRFKAWANEARLPAPAAQKLHDMYVGQFAEDLKAFEAEQGQKAKAAHETLVKEWGDPQSEDYIKERDAAVRALRHDKRFDGLEAELKVSGLLTKEGVFTSPGIARLLAAAGKQQQNDTFVGLDGQTAIAGNPFAKETYNLTEASIIASKDPARARQLAAAAGRDPQWIKDTIG